MDISYITQNDSSSRISWNVILFNSRIKDTGMIPGNVVHISILTKREWDFAEIHIRKILSLLLGMHYFLKIPPLFFETVLEDSLKYCMVFWEEEWSNFFRHSACILLHFSSHLVIRTF